MIKRPLVSIVVPTYNRDYILWKLIQSIQAQTYFNWELLIIDDRSTDATFKLMREFRYDKRIKYMLNKYAHSPAGARRFGQANATGDLIGYIDSDNTASSQWLQDVVKLFIEDKNAVFVFPISKFQNRLCRFK